MRSHLTTFAAGLMALLLVTIGGCRSDTSHGGGGSIFAPTVTSTTPSPGASGVAINTRIYARFSLPMKPSSLNGTSFTVTGPGTTPVLGNVSFNAISNVADFLPDTALTTGVLFTATITTEAESIGGKNMASDFSWTFTTGTASDTTAPTVTFTAPADTDTDVPVNMTLTAVFSESMDPFTVNATTFTLMQGVTPVAGAVSSTGLTATFNPTLDLSPSTLYTATITSGAEDASGNPLAADYIWEFTTGTAADTTAPTVDFTVPATNEIDIALNSSVMAAFSETMDPASLTTATFTLMQGATAVPGVVTCPGTTAMFNPNADLASATVYTATITIGATDAAGNPMTAPYTWNFTTGAAPDTTPPTVAGTIPDLGATNVRLSRDVEAIFDETMDTSTLTTANFTLMNGATAVTGTVTGAATSLTFNPTANLLPNTLYTATVTTGVEDLAGNPMAANYVWTFTTTADITGPTVESTIPADGEVAVYENRRIVAFFSEVMDPSSLTTSTFTLAGPGTSSVGGTVLYDVTNKSAVFRATAALPVSTVFTATITTGATDAVGNPLAAPYVWNFTTGTLNDSTAPTVTYTLPLNGATNVPLNARVTAIFSEPMNGMTITSLSFTVVDGAAVVGSVVCPYPATSATFIPVADLAPSTTYTATLTVTVADLAGNTLVAPVVWVFQTGVATMVAQNPVNLQSADDFVILAFSTVTNTGNSIVIGDVGLSTGTAVTGWGTVAHTGAIYVDPSPIAQQAKIDLTSAFNDAMGRSVDNIVLPANLGGLTLAPGLYTNGSTSGISGTGANAILTLDAQGDENAVWIFQMGSTLVCDPGTQIVLSGGAKAKNIYWGVGTSATLDTTVIFKGNILAASSVSMSNGANLEGRALARNGGVTLIANTVTKPAP